jgi:hypothetical protein
MLIKAGWFKEAQAALVSQVEEVRNQINGIDIGH